MAEQEEFAPVRAERKQRKLKIALSGPSGSGKTDGALSIATNFGATKDRSHRPKICVIDTENRSASLYADRYEFDVIELSAPYSVDRYVRAIKAAMARDYDWLILDSITPEWNGDGGILRVKEKLDMQPNANSFTNWARVSPQHEAFVEYIKSLPVNTICTMRSKTAYVLETDGRGKQRPRKVGMEPLQRDGIEGEFDLLFDIDMTHHGIVGKNRTPLFGDDAMDLRNPEIALAIRDWMEEGKTEAVPESVEPQPMPQVATKPDLIDAEQVRDLWIALRKNNRSQEEFREFLFKEFRLSSSREIPAENYNRVMQWALNGKAEKTYVPYEKEARELAKLLNVGESDLQYELSQAQGDWQSLAEYLASVKDAQDVAQEQNREQHEATIAAKRAKTKG